MSASLSTVALAKEHDIRVVLIRPYIGRIEAVCEWMPSVELLHASQGTDLHLSSHILDEKGQMLLFDCPRAKPEQGEHSNLAVVQLAIPETPGRYRIQIDPVVEWRFWASSQGYEPLALEAERTANGDVVIINAVQGARYHVPALQVPFHLDGPLYGVGDSERAVEIPWVLSRCRGASRVLDVGYANAEPRYVQARSTLEIPLVVGIDPAATAQQDVQGVAGDALRLPFRGGSFDLILAVSVIEHIGRSNEIYYGRQYPLNENGDFEAIHALAELLLPHGRMLVTVPFGAYEDHGWFVQYDWKRLEALVAASGCLLNVVECYAYGPEGWSGPVNPNTLASVSYRNAQGAAAAVACLELRAADSRETSVRASWAGKILDNSAFSSLAASLQASTVRTLKVSGAWTRMRGESHRLRPVMLFCETVNICNADCVFCPYSIQTRAKGFMSKTLFEKVLRQYEDIGGGYLTLTPMVGDALLDRYWMDRVRALAEKPGLISASITSNLYALGKYSDEDVATMLRTLHEIHVSCYGMTQAECESLTRRNLFSKFVEQMKRLLRLRDGVNPTCEIAIGFRLSSHREASDIEAFLHQVFGCVLPYGFTNAYANWGNAMEGALPGSAGWLERRFNNTACIMLPLALQVYWDGRVSASSCCDYDSSDQLYVGDLNRQMIAEIFNSLESQAVWRAHENGNLPPICRNCTFHAPLSSLTPLHPIANRPTDFIGG